MKTVLISAFIGSKNLGDVAIFKTILHKLGVDRQQITAVTINEERTQKDGVKTVYAKNPLNIVRAIKQCDVFLMGGGGIIQDKSSLLNFMYYAFQLGVAKYYKKPTILTFVGVGPLQHGVSRLLLKHLASGIDLAIVRDEKSKDILVRYMDEAKVMQVHDSVLNFVFDAAALPPSPYISKKPYVVVSLRRWFFTMSLLPVFITRKLNRLPMLRKKYEQFIANVASDLDEFLEKNPSIELVFTPFDAKEDAEVLAEVKSHMQHQGRVTEAQRELTEEEYLSIVSHAEFLIGMRLHSLILAANANKPFVALSYSPKVDEFTQQMGLADYSIHIERYDSARLQSALEAMQSNASKLAKAMPKVLSEYRRENDQAFDELRKRVTAILEK